MADKFVLPIGMDGENLINPLNNGIETLEKMQCDVASSVVNTPVNTEIADL